MNKKPATDMEYKIAVLERLQYYINKAVDVFNIDMETAADLNNNLAVSFDVTGGTAGLASWTVDEYGDKAPLIQFNLDIIKANYPRFLDRTVPHELAHILQDIIWPSLNARRSRREVHGKHWQHIMIKLGVTDYSRTHNYDMTNIKRKGVRQFSYVCSECGYEYKFSSRRHNLAVKFQQEHGKARYLCAQGVCKYRPVAKRYLSYSGEIKGE